MLKTWRKKTTWLWLDNTFLWTLWTCLINYNDTDCPKERKTQKYFYLFLFGESRDSVLAKFHMAWNQYKYISFVKKMVRDTFFAVIVLAGGGECLDYMGGKKKELLLLREWDGELAVFVDVRGRRQKKIKNLVMLQIFTINVMLVISLYTRSLSASPSVTRPPPSGCQGWWVRQSYKEAASHFHSC